MDVAAKAAALGAAAALMALLIKKSNAEIALCLALAGGAAVIGLTLGMLSSVADAARRAREFSGLSAALYSPMIKCVGAGVISTLAAETCRDAGFAQLAAAVELAGAAAALFCALPLVSALLDTLEALL